MPTSLFDRYRVIDIDTHITEPADVWTSRIAAKWGEQVPHVKRVNGADLWFIGDKPVGMPGAYSAAGHTGSFPDMRKTYDDIPPAMYDAKARLAFMDEEKLHAQRALPERGRLRGGRLPAHRRPGAGARLRARVQRLAVRVVRH